jgi:hypothetical protein
MCFRLNATAQLGIPVILDLVAACSGGAEPPREGIKPEPPASASAQLDDAQQRAEREALAQ